MLISALIVGLATAGRPVGVALIPPLMYRCWCELDSELPRRQKLAKFAIMTSWIVPIASSGLFAYMVYLNSAFDAPFAFAQTQQHWRMRPPITQLEHVLVLLSFEPIWINYIPDSGAYWKWIDHRCPSVFLSLQAGNPVLFLIAVAATVYGWRRKWLTAVELQISAGLLLIPYVTRSYEMCMASHGRFVLVALPVFVVIGQVLARVPVWVRCIYFVVSVSFLCAYTYSWTAGYLVI
ncbi:MAG: hypothetical protein R3C28_22900 [Pirellulaceae bacterium]